MKTYYCADCGSLDVNVERAFPELTCYRFDERQKTQTLTIEEQAPAARVVSWWCQECCGGASGAPAAFSAQTVPELVKAWLRRHGHAVRLRDAA